MELIEVGERAVMRRSIRLACAWNGWFGAVSGYFDALLTAETWSRKKSGVFPPLLSADGMTSVRGGLGMVGVALNRSSTWRRLLYWKKTCFFFFFFFLKKELCHTPRFHPLHLLTELESDGIRHRGVDKTNVRLYGRFTLVTR